MENIYAWVNFALFCAALVYFLREPVRDFLGDRKEGIRKELDALGLRRRGLEQKFQEYRQRLERSAQEMEAIVAELKREGESEKKNLIGKANQYAQNIQKETQRMSAQEWARGKRRLQEETWHLAVRLARQMLRTRINPDDHARLALWAVEKMEERKHAGLTAR